MRGAGVVLGITTAALLLSSGGTARAEGTSAAGALVEALDVRYHPGRDRQLLDVFAPADARSAGHPYPVYLPHAGDPGPWESPGTLLGIFEAEYPAQQRQLRPGDKLLVFTDGVPEFEAAPADPSIRLLAAAMPHRGLPVQALVERVSHDLFTQEPQPDDFAPRRRGAAGVNRWRGPGL